MPDVLSVPVINSRLAVVVSAIGAAGNGFLRITDTSSNVVASFQLSSPCGTITGGVLTLNGLTLIDPAAVGGVAALARFEDASGTVVMSGLTCGGGPQSGTDIVLSALTIPAGAAVGLTAATITGH
jgi:hypothetical protein